jgi:hypothetical protein
MFTLFDICCDSQRDSWSLIGDRKVTNFRKCLLPLSNKHWMDAYTSQSTTGIQKKNTRVQALR